MLKLQAKQTADNLREEISTLWDQLCIAEMHREEFLRTNSGCNPQTCNAVSRIYVPLIEVFILLIFKYFVCNMQIKYVDFGICY